MAQMIGIILELLVGALTLVVLLASAVLFVEVAAAILGGTPAEIQRGERRSVAVLMPAHDESILIASSIRAITPQLVEGDRLLVVADNCSDDTAGIAAAGGAEVLVRMDAERRGKGFAIDAGIQHLRSTPPAIVLILDADCDLSDGTVERLARACDATGRPAQALYLMRAPPGAPAPLRIAEFAWLVKNKVRAEGLYHLGLPCQLAGTGMAFPWTVISGATLATGNIVEDLQLGLELTRSGSPSWLCPGTLANSEFPRSSDGIKAQRTRWEHGHLGMIAREGPRFFLEALATRNWRLLAMTLDLCVPPTALLVLLGGLSWICGLCLFLVTGSVATLGAATVAVSLIVVSVLSSWAAYARGFLPLSDLLLSATYALRKIPLYARFLVARQVEWVRSRRD